MKIGILTFHRPLNYGAVLQAYALNSYIQKLGAQAQIIDYRCEVIEKMYQKESLFHCRTLKSILKACFHNIQIAKKQKAFEHFRKQMLPLSMPYHNNGELYHATSIYDRFVVGSDQVWNPNAHHFDTSYLLDFCDDPSKKYSYGASFGLSVLPSNLKEEYYKYLSRFSMCSVRETIGCEILRDLGINKFRVDLDPTMLLSREDWTNDLNIKKNNEEYIFAYYFELTDTMRHFIESLAKKTGLHVKILGFPVKSPFSCKTVSITPSPTNFVEAIANATYVVTNSFHGTVFSIIFNKEFFVELLQTSAEVNSRIENLLSTFSLDNRKINSFTKTTINDNTIDWDSVNKSLGSQKEKSVEYLRMICNDEQLA